MKAMLDLRQGDDLAEAYMEAWRRGPAWREALSRSLRTYEDELRLPLVRELAVSVGNLGGDPVQYGLTERSDSKEPR